MRLKDGDVVFTIRLSTVEYEPDVHDPEPVHLQWIAWLKRSIQQGNIWAWFNVDVSVRHNGVTCSTGLGGNSYRDLEDFAAVLVLMLEDVLGKLRQRTG
jgi:hypothetical protein